MNFVDMLAHGRSDSIAAEGDRPGRIGLPVADPLLVPAFVAARHAQDTSRGTRTSRSS
ncbi:MAG: hypothetical protein MZV64_74160 [Ignavibacteriales bacterium]|nr:hypothetical protein [Ignavibacteriales bacterium]